MVRWFKRGAASAALLTSAFLAAYLASRSAKSNPAPTLKDFLKAVGPAGLMPGGRSMTKKLVEACCLESDFNVLNVACGGGESDRLLAGSYGAMVTGVDASEETIELARGKAAAAGLESRLSYLKADIGRLPFKNESFDAVISEFAAGGQDKEVALREWVRVTKSGGCVGLHDVVWLREPSVRMRKDVLEGLGLAPETLTDWIEIFRHAGLVRMKSFDMSESWVGYSSSLLRDLGPQGIVRAGGSLGSTFKVNAVKVLPMVVKNEILGRFSILGYAIIVGSKPQN